MTMNLFKKPKSFTLLAFFVAVLLSASVTSCNRASQGEDKESTEHPSGSEHPSDSTATDTTKTQ